ncbi:lipopolysaccharide biosynthesis protein [Thermoflavimicrobium dichotomicum]|uniref:Membrane protein involved in the export of O-antigen and teichoic acid n=1 Tax=Thermoflavimicrobium dichotomicum TaxID=46223 RepID=A0A1I3LP88_9BACL|nr:oligosaccharide flippase family protein [Thermoflavimicrobium dichotomicum]SFI86589.1 Membrane protein involved in the export of O-antigen and teichoic acid [Thermoflavimicrobium dichotomicum]
MKALLKRLFSDSFAFAFVNIGNKLLAFVLFPIFIKYLSVNEYADWGITNTMMLVISYFVILGSDAALAFYYHDVKTNEERKGYLTATILLSCLAGIIFILAFFLLREPLSSVIYQAGTKNQWVLFTALVATMFSVINQLLLGYLRLERRKWVFVIFSILNMAGSSLVSIYFVMVLHQGLQGIFYGQLLGQGVVMVGLLLLLYRHFTVHVRMPYLKDLLQYGVPLLPTLMAFWVINTTSRLFVYYMISPKSAAIFDAASRVASYIVLLTASFQLAWRPFSMSIKDREDAPQLFRMLAKGVLIVGSLVVMGFSFIAEPMMKWLAGEQKPEYFEAYRYMWALSFSTVLNALHLIIGVGLFFHKKTPIVSRVFMQAAGIYLLGSVTLIPLFGLWAVCMMNILVYLLINLFLYRENQKIYPVDFRFRSMFIYIAMFIGLMSGITCLQIAKVDHLWLYYLLGLFALVVAVFASGLVSPKRLLQLRKRVQVQHNRESRLQ